MDEPYSTHLARTGKSEAQGLVQSTAIFVPLRDEVWIAKVVPLGLTGGYMSSQNP